MTIFTTPHNAAFRALDALEPGQHWSAFDVSLDYARAGKAKHFVTTIWNYHNLRDATGVRIPTEPAIAADIHDGSLWCRMAKPPVGTKNIQRNSHWLRIEIALENRLPVVGVLKDVHSRLCALSCVFDCSESRMQFDGQALWLKLTPRSAFSFETRPIDIHQITSVDHKESVLDDLNEKFAASILVSLQSSEAERRARLNLASKFPRRAVTTTSVFIRNPDVVAEVLIRAKGVCESCMKNAPFLRKSNSSPYLEVHHRIPLAQGGEDSIENALALCPNCHRGAHYG